MIETGKTYSHHILNYHSPEVSIKSSRQIVAKIKNSL